MATAQIKRPTIVQLDDSVTQGDWLKFLKLAGLEQYSDRKGGMCIRTIEAGKRHRAELERERQARLAHAQRQAAILREPFKHPELAP